MTERYSSTSRFSLGQTLPLLATIFIFAALFDLINPFNYANIERFFWFLIGTMACIGFLESKHNFSQYFDSKISMRPGMIGMYQQTAMALNGLLFLLALVALLLGVEMLGKYDFFGLMIAGLIASCSTGLLLGRLFSGVSVGSSEYFDRLSQYEKEKEFESLVKWLEE